MITKIQLRGDTNANWENVNPVLSNREVALVAMDSSQPKNYNAMKIGDGVKNYYDLPFSNNSNSGDFDILDGGSF